MVKYRGYDIVKASHPTPFDKNRETYDIMDGDRVRKANLATIELSKRVIDTMIKYSMWHDRSTTR